MLSFLILRHPERAHEHTQLHCKSLYVLIWLSDWGLEFQFISTFPPILIFQSTFWPYTQQGDDGTESVFSTSLPARLSRNRKGSIGQQASTPSDVEDGDELMDNDQNYLDIPVWIQPVQVGVMDGSPSVPSPSSELRSEFSVARKPLPALPPDAGWFAFIILNEVCFFFVFLARS